MSTIPTYAHKKARATAQNQAGNFLGYLFSITHILGLLFATFSFGRSKIQVSQQKPSHTPELYRSK